jgi:general secretion pathway protein D
MRVVAFAPGFAAAFLLAACGARPLAKSEAHIQTRETTQAATASIPEPVRGVPLPPAPRAREQELRYSVVVANQPVREVLLAMARETKLNFDIGEDVEGRVTINAIDQTLKQILTRMARQVDIRWEEHGNVISVVKDTPFLRTYHVDYVNMARDVTESVGIATQVISGSVGGAVTSSGTGSGNNNSTLSIQSTAKNRFWETLEKNVKDLLRETDKELPPGSSETFVQSRGANALTTTQSRAAAATRRANTAVNGARSTTVEGPGDTQTAQASETREERLTFREAASVIVNPETGIVSVRATSRQQAKVQEFLDQVAGSSKRQVLIEATIVEVDLSDNYQAGVDWSALGLNGLGYSISQVFTPPSLPSTPNALATSAFTVHYNNPNAAVGGSITSTVKLLDQFGRTRVLSSPKLMVINNQTAVLKVVDNRVYFTVKADTVTNQTTTTTTFTTTQNVVPVGFIMNVTPQISATDQVTLNLRPTVTRIIGTVADPNPSLAQAGVTSLVPITQTREMESVLKVGSGQTAVLGGLMLDSFEGTTNGLPIASRIPVLGDLVSQRNDLSTKSELVIFIRPVVVHDPSIETDLADYRRYLPGDKFFNDTHPPLPELQRQIDRIEQGKLPQGEPNPVVPDARAPSPGGQT